ncbi:KxYKxGKxW signal peptide domain-containing protein [Ligilactobacillus apodemi]|nr:KxYKxGKxW signal peptide domain-containing protein [Ligilactobacillus apodemi]
MENNELKKRYKMYKSGKNWVVAPIVFIGLALGLSANIDQVSADVNTQSDQTVEVQTTQSVAETDENKAATTQEDEQAISSQATEATSEESLAPVKTTEDTSETNSTIDEAQTEAKTAAATVSEDKQQETTEATTNVTDDQQATAEANETDTSEDNQQVATKAKTADTVANESEQPTTAMAESSQDKQESQTEDTADTFPTPTNYVEKQQDGYWYLYDTQTNTFYTGFQKLADGRVVYYNADGQMQYGWQWIDNATHYFNTFDGNMAIGQQKIIDHWYLFNEKGEMQRGFQYIADQNKTVYYNQDGWMLYGWQWLNNATYYFDTFDGNMATGQQNINNHWYLFNEKGEMQRGFQYIADQNKTVYYNQDGWMLYGQQKIDGYWYNFDTFDGAMKTDFVNIPDQNKTVYYNDKGQMQYGWQWIDNATRYFDTFDGKMATGQQNINRHWYLFNEKGEIQRGFQYISSQNKTVYYNQDGWMLYGVQQIDQNKYYFDLITGAMAVDSAAYDKATGTLSYYGKDGKQVTGTVVLDGKEYNFANGNLTVSGKQLVTLKGQTYLLSGSQVLTGQQKLNNNWYYFDENTGVMVRGFKYIADQNKTVYYADNGQMQYGWQDINGRRYFFDRVTGAEATSEILWIDGSAYAFDSQGGAHSFSELAQLVNQLGSNIAVAIQSQKSGQIYSYSNSGDMRFKTASTIKVAVLAELLHNTGGNLTAYQRSLAENMIRNSDNDATTNLITYHLHEAGNPVNSLYRDLGMTNTTPGTVGWGSTLTTPTDQLKLLYQIYMTDNSSYLNKQSQDYIKELMHTINVNQRWGISAGSSDYYLKNGWVTYTGPWYINSIGFIPDSGHGYTIAIYSYNNSYSTGINKVEQVARKVSQMLK